MNNMDMQFEETMEQLYSCLPRDRNKFNTIMENMKKRFLRNIKSQRHQFKMPFDQTKTYQQYIPNNSRPQNFSNFNYSNNKQNIFNSNNINNKKKIIPSKKYSQNINYMPIKMYENPNHYNSQRNFYDANKKSNKDHKKIKNNGFKGTIPDALLVNPKPLRSSSQQKLLNDTHANSNHYFPEKNNEEYEEDIDRKGNGWQNQANNIMFNTNENFYIANK